MILSMKVLLLGAAVTTATATATAQGTTRTTGTERTVHAGDYVTTITVDGTPTTITDDVKSVTAAPGAKVKVTAAPPQQGKRARLVITKAASSTSGQTQSEEISEISIKIKDDPGIYFAGDTYHLTAEVSPSSVTNKNVTWSVADGDNAEYTTDQECTYADIDNNGLLTCKARGNITIFATSTDGSYFKSSKFIVIKPHAIMYVVVNADGYATSVEGGKTLQMEANVIGPQSLDKTVTWSVFDIDDNVVSTDYPSTRASISTSGVLTPMDDGMVRVYAKSNYNTDVEGYYDILMTDCTGQASTGTNPEISPGGSGGSTLHHECLIRIKDFNGVFSPGQTVNMYVTDFGVEVSATWSVNILDGSGKVAAFEKPGQLTIYDRGVFSVTATLVTDPTYSLTVTLASLH
jgi:uncharacterized protein YjdB